VLTYLDSTVQEQSFVTGNSLTMFKKRKRK